jgi:hypothetical protein
VPSEDRIRPHEETESILQHRKRARWNSDVS